MPWDKESAREAQLKSAASRKRRADMNPEERARDAISAKLGDLTQELLNAALGEGDFQDLKGETRLTAILRSMEWVMGKAPTAPKPVVPEPDTGAPLTGEDLFESSPPKS